MTDTVTIACKLPNGMHLENRAKPTTKDGPWGEPTRVTINGTAQARRVEQGGLLVPSIGNVLNNFGLTHGVDKAFWERWLDENKSNPLVVNGIIFAHDKQDTIAGLSLELKDVKSGLDPLVPLDDKVPNADGLLRVA